jgi:hypothetical protein
LHTAYKGPRTLTAMLITCCFSLLISLTTQILTAIQKQQLDHTDAMSFSLYPTISVALSSAIIYLITRAIYDIFLHPLANVPGPLLAKVGCLWKFNAATSLKFADKLRAVHAQYGPVSVLPSISFNTYACVPCLSITIIIPRSSPRCYARCRLSGFRSSRSVRTHLTPNYVPLFVSLPKFSHSICPDFDHPSCTGRSQVVRIAADEVSVISPEDVKTIYGHKSDYIKGAVFGQSISFGYQKIVDYIH